MKSSAAALTLLLIVCSACGSTEQQKEPDPVQPVQENAAMADTTESDDDSIEVPPPPKPDPGPELARVEGIFLGMAGSGTHQADSSRQSVQPERVIRLRITAVRETGSAIPPIGDDKEISVFIPAYLLDMIADWKKDKKIVSLLKYQQVSTSDSSVPRWVLRQFSAL